jgi:hypothetical protein
MLRSRRTERLDIVEDVPQCPVWLAFRIDWKRTKRSGKLGETETSIYRSIDSEAIAEVEEALRMMRLR